MAGCFSLRWSSGRPVEVSERRAPPGTLETSSVSECEDTLTNCSRKFLAAADLEPGKSPKFNIYRLGERDGRNLTIMFVTVKVTDDDSLTGIRYRLALSLGDVEDKSYKLENLGRQFTCARGHKYWSMARCP
jgi:hypothetical protein